MSPTKEELKIQLMAEAEKAINQMVEEAKEKDLLTITDIERLARKMGNQVMKEATQQLAEQNGVASEEKPCCPDCGQPMRYKGQKGKILLTETGEIRLERDYYYCETCRKGVFPPG